MPFGFNGGESLEPDGPPPAPARFDKTLFTSSEREPSGRALAVCFEIIPYTGDGYPRQVVSAGSLNTCVHTVTSLTMTRPMESLVGSSTHSTATKDALTYATAIEDRLSGFDNDEIEGSRAEPVLN